ncbi:CoA-substrate-specific enzyme activase, putative [Maridesulfovibrio ferrireducens]|uniref:CoA-substrate-specific enzyme activase, putative n=1 Tax=Maridesulfovibrio ferrireducens TaxID=246191 RepID=A0A1G9AUI9_9BACT|nr:acyl-CoA dehydratase activase [Maridesulfovibrio ferrireducens]SDK30971.1 CoA-substrate-specific enzyme activase, putative [Maridesulfovibrio ferrireducens]
MIAGIDIGSRSMELVLLDKNGIVLERKLPTTFDPASQLKIILDGVKADLISATGYGRKLVTEEICGAPCVSLTEIKAYALGISYLFPEARTILDIGGQDTKAISLMKNGKVAKFEMNDRCAAGTGKFLEHLATVFQLPIEEFGNYALGGTEPLTINSMCTVFAETEATSLMAQGKNPRDIALGLHASIVRRTTNMLHRVGLSEPFVFAGGVANNPCVINMLTDALNIKPLIPEGPDMVGALGSALYGKSLTEIS